MMQVPLAVHHATHWQTASASATGSDDRDRHSLSTPPRSYTSSCTSKYKTTLS